MTAQENIKISVLIPFYQKQKGVLAKSLHSIFSQSAKAYITEVIVVDDGSPCPVEDEVQQVIESYDFTIPVIVLKQANSGVSAARNTALRHVDKDTTHIAFLDSDDRWQADHIDYAVKAIKLGAKFFFSNHYQLNSELPAFEKSSNFDVASCEKLDNEIYRYNKCFINQIVLSNPVGTSTVVYERFGTEDLYFDRKFKYAGEDYMMWISLARRLRSIYFCTLPTVTYDAGVNIFSGAKWGSLHLSNRLIDEIAYKKAMLALPELNDDNRQIVVSNIKSLKHSLVKNMRSRLLHLKFAGVLKMLRSAYF